MAKINPKYNNGSEREGDGKRSLRELTIQNSFSHRINYITCNPDQPKTIMHNAHPNVYVLTKPKSKSNKRRPTKDRRKRRKRKKKEIK